MLYMYLAVPAVAVAAKGAAGGMGAMDAGRARFSVLALVLALFMLGYVVRVSDRLTARAPALALAVPAATGPQTPTALMTAAGPEPASPQPPRPSAACAGADRAPRQPRSPLPSPPVRRALQDRDGDHHGLHADPHALAAASL